MTVRQTLTWYFAIWCAGITIAGAAVIWLGPDVRVPIYLAGDGAPIGTRSAAVLWFAPLLLTILYGTMGLGAWVEARRRGMGIELGEDARRGLFHYGLAVRRTMIGFGLLLLLIEGLTVLRAAGMNAPLGLGREGTVRLFYFIAGLLFAYIGNATPKLPYIRHRARDHHTNRAIGWIITIGGIGYAAAAILLPFEQMQEAGNWLIGAMLGLSLLRYLWALARYRPQDPSVE